jgi:hypothetical protein
VLKRERTGAKPRLRDGGRHTACGGSVEKGPGRVEWVADGRN